MVRGIFQNKRARVIGIVAILAVAGSALAFTPLASAIKNLFIGSTQVKDIQLGNIPINAVYQGSTLIWERQTLQNTTAATCTTTRTKVNDARDNNSYWIQRLADGNCWMLTNLAYAGGGNNTYGDATTITQGTTAADATYTEPHYFVPPNANPTKNAETPSTSTDGGATNPQYGYLYNWCAAMGNQPSACQDSAATQPNQSKNPGNGTVYNICPAGWRLPIGGTGGEFESLNNAINGSSTTSPSGLLGNGLFMYGGYWDNGSFTNQGVYGYYWSSTINTARNNYGLVFSSTSVTSVRGLNNKRVGGAVRCVLGEPPAPTLADIQQVGTGKTYSCPVNRTKVRDARDDATYWIRKIPGTASGGGDLCWMETNLAYAGGGTNTYGDIINNLVDGTTDSSGTYTEARYYISSGANRTSAAQDPSADASGAGQYGYHYNWCAAMGGQANACQQANTLNPNQSANPGNGTIYNVCPAGWRLPTGGSTGEFKALNDAINGGATTSPGLFATGLYMRSGIWEDGSFKNLNSAGAYHSSSTAGADAVFDLYFNGTTVYPENSWQKILGKTVRCVAE